MVSINRYSFLIAHFSIFPHQLNQGLLLPLQLCGMTMKPVTATKSVLISVFHITYADNVHTKGAGHQLQFNRGKTLKKTSLTYRWLLGQFWLKYFVGGVWCMLHWYVIILAHIFLSFPFLTSSDLSGFDIYWSCLPLPHNGSTLWLTTTRLPFGTCM